MNNSTVQKETQDWTQVKIPYKFAVLFMKHLVFENLLGYNWSIIAKGQLATIDEADWTILAEVDADSGQYVHYQPLLYDGMPPVTFIFRDKAQAILQKLRFNP